MIAAILTFIASLLLIFLYFPFYTLLFLIISSNILYIIINLRFDYVIFILARIIDTFVAYEFTIMIAATLSVMVSWLLIFLYFKKGINNILYIFFIAGLI